MVRPWFLGVSLLLCVWRGFAQAPSFEVVSIKINKSGSANGGMGPRGSRLVGTNVTLNLLLMYAYRPPNGRMLDAQIVGEPNWAKTEHYDIEAKPEGDARVVGGEETRAMVRSLLEDRFQLKLHRESRELPVYNLMLAKSGAKLSEDQTPPEPGQAFISVATQGEQLGPLPRGALRMVMGPAATALTGTAVSIATIVALLQSKSDRIIVDKTAFSGLIDVNLTFRQDLASDANVPGSSEAAAVPDQSASLFTAIQEIGMKLAPGKALLDVLVIDRVERPSLN